jgi:hypothetical protein
VEYRQGANGMDEGWVCAKKTYLDVRPPGVEMYHRMSLAYVGEGPSCGIEMMTTSLSSISLGQRPVARGCWRDWKRASMFEVRVCAVFTLSVQMQGSVCGLSEGGDDAERASSRDGSEQQG